jgi:hypothetical protein
VGYDLGVVMVDEMAVMEIDQWRQDQGSGEVNVQVRQ